MSYVVYNPILGAKHEIDGATRNLFVAAALKAEKQIQDNPSVVELVMYNPAVRAYQELPRATVSDLINEAKKIA